MQYGLAQRIYVFGNKDKNEWLSEFECSSCHLCRSYLCFHTEDIVELG
jgi:hypothetical protein